MKKLVFSLLLIGAIIMSGLVGYADQHHNETAGKEGDLGSSIFSLKFLNK
ncbi:hypothetical protein [Terribacillus saccharophilus]|nr:hypothetical protein [Terribacillus saccharophilus]